MGRRYFYAVVDETHRRIKQQNEASTDRWDDSSSSWFRETRKRHGKRPLR